MLISNFMYQRKESRGKKIKNVALNSIGVGSTATVVPALLLTKRGKGTINSLLTGTAHGVKTGLKGKINKGAAYVGSKVLPKGYRNLAKQYTKGNIADNQLLTATTAVGSGGLYAGNEARKSMRKDKR